MYSIASSTKISHFGLSKPQAIVGKCSLQASITSPSISQRTTFSTVSCLSTSRTVPPSPPPITSTVFGFGWCIIGTCAIIS